MPVTLLLFVLWTLSTEPDTAVAMEWFPLWFVLLAGGWLIVRRRPGHAEQYRMFQAEMNYQRASDDG